MRTIVSSEKVQVTKVRLEAESGRADTLFIYGHDVPAVVDALRTAFGQPEDNPPVGHVRKKRLIKKTARVG